MKTEQIIEDGIEYTVKTYEDDHLIQAWFLNGARHRVNGPALIYSNGSTHWYQYGVLHREDGPAVTYPNGYQEWRLNGQLHRADGPTVIFVQGRPEWWYYNNRIDVATQPEFEQWLKLRVFE